MVQLVIKKNLKRPKKAEKSGGKDAYMILTIVKDKLLELILLVNVPSISLIKIIGKHQFISKGAT